MGNRPKAAGSNSKAAQYPKPIAQDRNNKRNKHGQLALPKKGAHQILVPVQRTLKTTSRSGLGPSPNPPHTSGGLLRHCWDCWGRLLLITRGLHIPFASEAPQCSLSLYIYLILITNASLLDLAGVPIRSLWHFGFSYLHMAHDYDYCSSYDR